LATLVADTVHVIDIF